MERTAPANQRQQAVDQLLAFVIGQRAQRPEIPEMFGLVSVTPRAAQRALAGDLDRQHRMMAAQNAAPAAENISFFHCEPLLPLVGARVEDRGLRIEDRGSRIAPLSVRQSSILDPRSSILEIKPVLSPWCCRSSREAPV